MPAGGGTGERGAHPLAPLRTTPYHPVVRSSRGHLGLRPVLDRHRPVQLPHGRPDARGRPVRPAAAQRGAAGVGRIGPCRAVRLARRHRPRPRHAQGGPARPGGRFASHGRRGEGRRPGGRDQDRRPAESAGRARDRVLLRRRHGPAPPQGPAVPRERHDPVGVRRLGRGAAVEDVLLGRRWLRRRRGRGRRGPHQTRRHRPEVPLPHRRRAVAPGRGDGSVHLGADAGERARLAHRGRDPGRPAGDLAGDARRAWRAACPARASCRAD